MDLLPKTSPAAIAALAAVALALAACGGGGGSPADVRPGPQPPAIAPDEPNEFLLFPNPQRQPDGTLQTNTAEYAEAYYRAVDPANERDTLAKFQARNGFGTGTGTEVGVVFGDRRDLGYGRRMYGRRNPDGTIAFYVENYLVQAGQAYEYSPLNLEAAIVRDSRWIVAVNAIEFSPGPNGGASFAKFYSYSPTGARQLFVDLDNRGPKAMPGPCITCHGGRADALTPPDGTGKRRFHLVQNTPSGARGDAQGHLQPFEPDTFDFSTRAGFSRAEQEAAFKALNAMILCTYPLESPSSHPEDACRRAAGAGEWQGSSVAALVKSAYGGDGLPSATFLDDYVPPSWAAAGQGTLYREVVVPACRTCHASRGSKAQSDIDFSSYEKFVAYADRTKAHVFDRGDMPLAFIVYDAFWDHPARPALLAAFLEGQGIPVRDSSGALPRPGRPIADPGPDRVAAPGAIPLSAERSLFATGYAWSLVSGPSGASLEGATSERATLVASVPGNYVLQLVASNGARQSAPVQVRVTVSPALSPAPPDLRFADVKAVMQARCVQCHSATSPVATPVFYTSSDRNGDGTVGDATDEAWLHAEVRGLVNFTDLAASPLLRKPAGHHHGGGRVTGFDDGAEPGAPERAAYDLILNWILNGAPQ